MDVDVLKLMAEYLQGIFWSILGVGMAILGSVLYIAYRAGGVVKQVDHQGESLKSIDRELREHNKDCRAEQRRVWQKLDEHGMKIVAASRGQDID